MIGVFLNCVSHERPAQALAAVKTLGLKAAQIGRLPDEFYKSPQRGGAEIRSLLETNGIRATSVVIVFDGESYADWEAVSKTVGYRPATLLKERLAHSKRCIDLAAEIGAGVVTTHMGILPKDEADPMYRRLFEAVQEAASYGETRGIMLSLETGQETGDDLAAFLEKFEGQRVHVNFDTANLILYGMQDSPAALTRLLNRVTSAHVKDGDPPLRPGALGVETRLGDGRAEVAKCLRILRDADFDGPLIIENYVARVLRTDPLDEIRRAKEFIENVMGDK